MEKTAKEICKARKIPRPEWGKIEIWGTKEVNIFINDEYPQVHITTGALKTIYQIVSRAIFEYGYDMRACVSDETLAIINKVRFCKKHLNLFIVVPKICEDCEFIELKTKEFKKFAFNHGDFITCLINDKTYYMHSIMHSFPEKDNLKYIVVKALEEAGFEDSEMRKTIKKIHCSLWCEKHKRLFLYI